MSIRKYIKYLSIILAPIALFLFGSSILTSCSNDTTCKHEAVEEEIIEEATCIKDGKVLTVCITCGETIKEKTIPADSSKHVLINDPSLREKNDEEKNNALCGEVYSVFGKCKYCEEIDVIRKVTNHPHEYGPYETWYEQVIDNNGEVNEENHIFYEGYRCTYCHQADPKNTTRIVEYHNAKVKHDTNYEKTQSLELCQYFDCKCSCGYEYGQQISHAFDAGRVIIEPTCLEDGLAVYTCQNDFCLAKTFERVLPSLGHSFSLELENKNCIDRVCTRCNNNILATEEHHYDHEGTCFDKVCITCGDKVLKTTNHEFIDSYPCHDRKCIHCEYVIKATINHDLGINAIDKREDCTVPGFYHKVCRTCGDLIEYEYEYVSTVHRFDIPIESQAPTCLEDGYHILKCHDCETTETKIISATGHNNIITNTVAPTCEENGYRDYQCRNCGLKGKEVLLAPGHTYKDSYLCHDRYCSVCGKVSIHTENHQPEEGSKFCKICHESIVNETPVLVYDPIKNVVTATVPAIGIKYYINGEYDPYAGSMAAKPDGVYIVTAKNINEKDPLLSSEESAPLKVVICNSNITISKASQDGNDFLWVNVPVIDGADIKIKVELFEGNKLVDSFDQKIKAGIDKVKVLYSETAPNATKVVITLVLDEENAYLSREIKCECAL